MMASILKEISKVAQISFERRQVLTDKGEVPVDRDGAPIVKYRDYYSFVGDAGMRVNVNGVLVPIINIQGIVDDEIKKTHAEAYAAFLASLSPSAPVTVEEEIQNENN